MPKEILSETEKQDETVTLITDGAYAGEKNTRLAADKNINLITTDLPGQDAPEILSMYELNEDETRVVKCPMGYTPKSSSYIRQTQTCTASFPKQYCENCPHKEDCNAKIFKKVAKIRITGKLIRRAELQKKMKGDEYKLYARLRNGVETVPSILRNVYHADRMRAKGKIRNKFFFGSKVAAFNFRKLFNFRKGRGNYAKNPLLTAIN